MFPAQEVYFEVPSVHRELLHKNAETFLLAGLVAAMHLGEARILVEGTLCPKLVDGLNIFQRLIRYWHGTPRTIVEIEATEGLKAHSPIVPASSACFLSGGVDSLFTLRLNHSQFTHHHPYYVETGILAYGLDIGDPNKRPREDIFRSACSATELISSEAGIRLFPVKTNVRDFFRDWRIYDRDQYGSLLCSIAHACSGIARRFYIATDNTTEHLGHRGGHPRLILNCSSTLVEFEVSGERYSRLEKVKQLSTWPSAIKNLRVCYQMDEIPEGYLNCGKCHKCVRTLAELYVTGCIDQAYSFPSLSLTPEMFSPLAINQSFLIEYYEELIEPLCQMGRLDIADAVRLQLELGAAISLRQSGKTKNK